MSRSNSPLPRASRAPFLPADPPWLERQGGEGTEEALQINVVVVPRASRTRVMGVLDQRLKIQLAAPPVDGQANDALVRYLADILEIARAQVQIVGGQTSKRKTVRLLGVRAGKVLLKLSP